MNFHWMCETNHYIISLPGKSQWHLHWMDRDLLHLKYALGLKHYPFWMPLDFISEQRTENPKLSGNTVRDSVQIYRVRNCILKNASLKINDHSFVHIIYCGIIYLNVYHVSDCQRINLINTKGEIKERALKISRFNVKNFFRFSIE